MFQPTLEMFRCFYPNFLVPLFRLLVFLFPVSFPIPVRLILLGTLVVVDCHISEPFDKKYDSACDILLPNHTSCNCADSSRLFHHYDCYKNHCFHGSRGYHNTLYLSGTLYSSDF